MTVTEGKPENFSVANALKKLPEEGKKLLGLQKYLSKKNWTSNDRKIILTKVSSLLSTPNFTTDVAVCFSGLLLELLFHLQNEAVQEGKPVVNKHELLCLTLSQLVSKYPDAARFAQLYFESNPSVFLRYHDYAAEPQRKKIRTRKCIQVDDKAILQSALFYLLYNPEFFSVKWDWSVILLFIQSENEEERWLASQCYSFLTQMTESQKKAFMLRCMPLPSCQSLSVKYHSASLSNSFGSPLPVYISRTDSVNEGIISNEDLCPEVVRISGVLLHKITRSSETSTSEVVSVETTRNALHKVAEAVSSGQAVLVKGVVGCGKTSLIDHIAVCTGRQDISNVVRVQLGEQADSKMLIGNYCCTDVPGRFLWHQGPLIQAMTEGHWLILEDIDYAPMDVISLLIPVVQSRTIALPGHAESIRAAAGFQLFCTQRLVSHAAGYHSEFKGYTDILSVFMRVVNLSEMTRDELQKVISIRWPKLTQISNKILDIYYLLCNFKCHSKKPVTQRDLMKFCFRTDSSCTNFNSRESAMHILQDAIDCFCLNIPTMKERILAAGLVASQLNFTPKCAVDYCSEHCPSVTVPCKDEDCVAIGRVSLNRKTSSEMSVPKPSEGVFAQTKQALCLLERVARSVENDEPVLLVGETGTGKTTVVQYLASLLERRLSVINMNQQSDFVDFIGGYKPVEIRVIMSSLKKEHERLFRETFSQESNEKFLAKLVHCFNTQQWEVLLKVMKATYEAAVKKMKQNGKKEDSLEDWEKLSLKLDQLLKQVNRNTLFFSFIEGTLVKAMKEGCWILLDEINLAEAETLECLSSILESRTGSILLTEKGDSVPVKRHPDFRLFACMNPASDVGKKDLPAGIRNRFTEFYIEDLEEESDLKILVGTYLKGLCLDEKIIERIVKFYLKVRVESAYKLTDGIGHRPHYSLRTLCRALSYAAKNPCNNTPKSIYEGFCFSFLTQLDTVSYQVVDELIKSILLKNQLSALSQKIPSPVETSAEVEGYWIRCGSLEPTVPDNYILTPTVTKNLKDLARAVSSARHPILLQGETSVGKTSLVQYLAKRTGNVCLRLNNHEHTDLQEYIGTYCADAKGKLVFKEGVLVTAMRNGYWIIIDELNLASSEILEALNRVLDDNRELLITETQEIIKAHPKFILFATQNPPGHYGGRKLLSRAFRNRFIELHFNEIPSDELKKILSQGSQFPLSYASKLVNVMRDLQLYRSQSGVFAGKHGYMTLRDLFRWAQRYCLCNTTDNSNYDWLQHIADEGYMLLAGKLRNPEEEAVVINVLEKHLRRRVEPQKLFSLESLMQEPYLKCHGYGTITLPEEFSHIVWTYSARRLAVLVSRALQYGESTLLVGHTGCGKTTICQLLAKLQCKNLYTVNCHMHSEASDFLGSLRPVRHEQSLKDNCKKLFEWVDGPLINAMKEGMFFLTDEISLAEDSVLERLNSLLELEKTLLLSECADIGEKEMLITAHSNFRFLATMNPGGDFGKKELSPALRNRFTEIWCINIEHTDDMIAIVDHNLHSDLITSVTVKAGFAKAMIEFVTWFSKHSIGRHCVISIRDILSWVEFINSTTRHNTDLPSKLSLSEAFLHGACLILLDSLGSGSTAGEQKKQLDEFKSKCLQYLNNQVISLTPLAEKVDVNYCSIHVHNDWFGVGPFFVSSGPRTDRTFKGSYILQAHTPGLNACKLLRALQVRKPILLEGVPGVGKTSLVSAIAKAAGYDVVRINLSEQTDISDLFGADLPVTGSGGKFAWRDGPLLQALKSGSWILLDELNLASQSVLEGLNACLDHRGEIFVPELGRTFLVSKERSRIFACQNPYRQGGARKGLPKSFLNRFVQVFIEPLTKPDFLEITKGMFPLIPLDVLEKMIDFNQSLIQNAEGKMFFQKGSPWEFNLRDIFRWTELMYKDQFVGNWNPGEFVGLLYGDRMRTLEDKEMVSSIFESVFQKPFKKEQPRLRVTESIVQVGYSVIQRSSESNFDIPQHLRVLKCQTSALESVMKCFEMNWMPILVGNTSVGKTSIVQQAALLCGKKLNILSVNSEMDTIELLGGFEQVDYTRTLSSLTKKIKDSLQYFLRHVEDVKLAEQVMRKWAVFQQLDTENDYQDEVDLYLKKVDYLLSVIGELKMVIKTFHFEQLENELQRLSKYARTSRNLTSGGEFEWMDSLLVKSLLHGHWLLIDNVNFCSSSVLDRLNGLLEPNGRLILNEQGSVDGQLREIVPHEEFRIILAMDPKYGEISRAMRNRGVEIYLLSEHEGNIVPSADKISICSSVGLTDVKLQQCVIRIYSTLSSLEPSRFNISNLVKAASHCVQKINQGLPKMEALLSSCTEVYEVSDFTDDQQRKVKETFFEAASKTVMNISSENYRLFTELYQTVFFPPVFTFALNSDVSDAQIESNQICYTLMKAAGHTSFTEEYHSLPVMTERSSQMLNLAVCLYYETASHSNWQVRSVWLDHILSSLKVENVLQWLTEFTKRVFESDVVQKLCQFWTSHELSCLATQYPVDLRFSSAMLKRFIKELSMRNLNLSCVQHMLESSFNRFHLLLAFELMRVTRYEECGSSGMNCLRLSKKVLKRTESRDTIPHPCILYLNAFFEQMDEGIQKWINSSGKVCEIQQYQEILNALIYYRRFFEVCISPFSKESASVHISILALHWFWIENRVLRVLFPSAKEMSPALLSTVTDMTESLSDRLHKQCKLRSEIVGQFGSPTLLETPEKADLFLKTLNTSRAINVHFRGNDYLTAKKQTLLLYLVDQKHWVGDLKNCLSASLFQTSCSQVTDKIDDIQSGVTQLIATVEEMEESDITMNSSVPELFIKFHLMPLRNVFFSIKETFAISEMLNNSQCSRYLLTSVINDSEHLHLQPMHSATLSAAAGGQEAKNELSVLLIEHLIHTWTSLKMAASFLGLKTSCILKLSPEDKHFHEKLKCLEHYRLHQTPVVSLLNCTLTSFTTDLKTLNLSVPLIAYLQKLKELETQKHLLWKNSMYLTHQEHNVWVASARTVIRWFENLVYCIPGLKGFGSLSLEEWIISSDLNQDIKELLLETQQCVNQLKESLQNNLENCQKALIGMCWVKVGLCTTILLTPWDTLDPQKELNLELKYSREEARKCESEIGLRSLTVSFSPDLVTEKDIQNVDHPIVKNLLSNRVALQEKITELESRVGYRPLSPDFQELAGRIQHYIKDVGSPKRVCEVAKKFSQIQAVAGLPKDREKIVSWIASLQGFLISIYEEYPLYRDVTGPFLCGVAQIIEGTEILLHFLVTARKNLNLDECGFYDLWQFPYISEKVSTPHSIVSEICKSNTEHIVLCTLSSAGESAAQVSYFTLLKSACLELLNFSYLKKDPLPCRDYIENIFTCFFQAWEKEDAEKSEKKEVEDSLYEIRTHHYSGEASDESKTSKEIETLFPSYEEDYYGVIPTNMLEDQQPQPKKEAMVTADYFTDNNMSFIWKVHSLLVYNLCSRHSLVQFGKQLYDFETSKPDFVTPFLLRYKVLHDILVNYGQNFNPKLDEMMLGSHLLATSVAEWKISDDQEMFKTYACFQIEDYDLYHDPNIEESKKCYQVVTEIVKRVEELLEKFPDHPTLKQIVTVSSRLLGFPVTSPIIKFLTGLEILLGVVQEWESTAHRGVSFSATLRTLRKLIIAWRKLELTHWSKSLDTIEKEHFKKSARFWFLLFNNMEAFLKAEKNESCPDETKLQLTKTLLQFMECSTVGDFKARLNLLFTFLCHTLCAPLSPRQAELASLLYNVHSFYSQFLESVKSKLASDKKPIEKELKEFVKIIKWNDENFWTVKHTVEKSVRMIHKHMKDFKKILLQKASASFLIQKDQMTSEGSWNAELNVSESFKGYEMEPVPSCEIFANTDVLSNASKISRKMKKVSGKIVSATKLPGMISGMNVFAGQIACVSKELQELNTPQNLDKEKQKQEVRFIHRRKRKALADLFKQLTHVGISFRKGILLYEEYTSEKLMETPALDLEGEIDTNSFQNELGELKEKWQGCHGYYYRCLSDFSALKISMQTPSKELELTVVERCRGFAGHLVDHVVSQKKKLTSYLGAFIQLKNLAQNLKAVAQSKNFHFTFPSQELLEFWSSKIQEVMIQVICFLRQFSVMLAACPSSSDSKAAVESQLCDKEELNMLQSELQTVVKELESCLKSVSAFASSALKCWSSESVLVKGIYSLNQAYTVLHKLNNSKLCCESTKNVFGSSIAYFINTLKTVTDEFQADLDTLQCADRPREANSLNLTKLVKISEKASSNILLALQNIHRYYKSVASDVKPCDSDESDSEDDLVEKHFTKIEEELLLVFGLLNIAKIKKSCSKLVKEIRTVSNSNSGSGMELYSVLISTYPLISQYVDLVQYFFTNRIMYYRTTVKFVHIILSVFGALAQKGFCLPAEFQDELLKEQGTEFKEIESGGLGEGEGEKDVGDKITSEDQLEGTEQDEQDTKDDVDLKDEEHGIEMSDDFKGKAHQPTKEETQDDESSEESELEDLDKQMGDVEDNEADMLDKQLWNEDSDEEDISEDQKKNSTGKSNQTTDSELVAKDDNQDAEPEKGNEEHDQQGKPDEINQLDNDEYEGEQEDPYRNNKPEEEAQDLEIPEDLKLDEMEEGDQKADDNDESMKDENPLSENEDENKEEEKMDADGDDGSMGSDKENDEALPEEQKDEPMLPEIGNDETNADNNENEDVMQHQSYDKYGANAEEHPQNESEIGQTITEPLSESMEPMQSEPGSGQVESEEHQGRTGQKLSRPQTVSQKSSGRKERKIPDPLKSRNINKEELKAAYEKVEIIDFSDIDSSNTTAEPQKNDLYQHIPEESEVQDAVAPDIVPEEAARDQQMTSEDVKMEDIDDRKPDEKEEIEKLSASALPPVVKSNSEGKPESGEVKNDGSSDSIPILQGKHVSTSTVHRRSESTIHTQESLLLKQVTSDPVKPVHSFYETTPDDVIDADKAIEIWQRCEKEVAPLVQELCEQLRCVLEPTKTTKLKGDYRTGKRLNMRKIIPYIASQFRKDKIWMRRTKPHKRQYDIILAVDDSSSMVANNADEMSYKSLTLLAKALSLLETGNLAVTSFGKCVKLLHDFKEPFTSETGVKVFRKFSFAQKNTRVDQLLNFTTAFLAESRLNPQNRAGLKEIAQLLIIVSDGRGLFSEGEDTIRKAVHEAKDAGIFIVFIIIDSNENSQSILDVNTVEFTSTGDVKTESYMEKFPFPFYIILRDIASMPHILGQALRQWFELVTEADR